VTTPDSMLTATSNSPNIPSLAETVLAEATRQEASSAASPSTEDHNTGVGEGGTSEANGEAPEAQGDAPRKRSLSWNDAIKQVPPDIANLMKNMQGDYTRKTQELAEQRKEFLRDREALMKGAKTLEDREIPEYDPFNEDTVKARIEAEVTRRLREVLEPMQQEYEVMQAEDSYKSFLSEHPEFETDVSLRSEVQHLLENNSSLDLETAYWAARGKQAKFQRAEDQQRQKASRAALKEAALKGTGNSRKVTPGGVPDRGSIRRMSNSDLLALAQSMNRNR